MWSCLNLAEWSFVSCAVLRQKTSVYCLWLGQNSSFQWTLSTTRIFQKCIETVHPGKCDFTVSKTLDMVIKRLNMCCLFCWQQWLFFFFLIELLKLNRMKPLQDFLSNLVQIFIWRIIVSLQTITKKSHKNNCFSGFLTTTSTSPRHSSPGACLKYTPQKNILLRQKVVPWSWPVKLSDKDCNSIAHLRQPKTALLSAPAACHAPTGEPEDLDAAG